ncbi:hypothetical protein ACWCOV_38710 [Kribbella sp. NPDC002412]
MPAGSTVAYRNINGDPSAILLTGDAPFAVMVLDLDGAHGTGVYSITKSDKLTRI